jgi:hypothetical protein
LEALPQLPFGQPFIEHCPFAQPVNAQRPFAQPVRAHWPLAQLPVRPQLPLGQLE